MENQTEQQETSQGDELALASEHLRAETFTLTHHLELLRELRKYDIDSIKLLIQTLDERRFEKEKQMYEIRQLKLFK